MVGRNNGSQVPVPDTAYHLLYTPTAPASSHFPRVQGARPNGLREAVSPDPRRVGNVDDIGRARN
jgi:hypothetical protein